jgi:SAM-dependent methyltransferase
MRFPASKFASVDVTRDLRSYYEAEARLRVRAALSEQRIALIEDFITLLQSENRRSVVDFGAGPGHDGERFVGAGHTYVGVDLAHGNALLAAERNVTVVQAHLAALPFKSDSFEAGWSMSTLMHFPETEVPAAMRAMSETLQPGAPFLVGVWGGDDGDVISDSGIEGHRRFFSLRSHEQNGELLTAGGAIEWSTTWNFGAGEWAYHLFRLRAAV